MGRAGAARAAAAPSLTLARSCAHREETSSRPGLPRPPRPGAAGSARGPGRPAHPSVGAPRLAGGGVTSHPGRRGAPALRKPERGRGAGASRATSPGASGPQWARRPPPPPGRRGDHSRAWYLWTPLSSAWSSPGGAEPRTDMLLPFPAPSERRGVGEAGPSRCTEETPSRGRTGPAAGALGPARGWRAGRPRPTGRRARGGQPAQRRPFSAAPRPGQARTRRRGRTGRAQQPDPGRPRFEAGNGCSGPGRLAFRLCDCDGPTGAQGG